MTWLIIGIVVVFVAVAVLFLACCVVSGDYAQREEDERGVENARRS